MNRSTLILLTLAPWMTAACSFGPQWAKVRPQMETPAVFRSASIGGDSIADLPWQAVLNDADMQNLLQDVFNNNGSLAAMEHNVEMARQSVTIAAAPLFPWFGYAASASKGMNQSGGAGIAQMGGITTTPGSVAANASWELDIWGKTRKDIEGAQAEAQGAQDQLNNLRISLMKQVACGYLQLIMLDDQLRIAKDSVVSYEETLELFQHQLDGGVANKLQTASAEAALAAAQAEVPQLESQIAQLENTLSALAGRAPGRIARRNSLPSFSAASSVPAGIPADVLARRPDIRAKEQAMRAANADIGVAIASYFPSISLTGAMGYASSDLTKAIHGHRSGWGIGANLTGPLFRAGQLRANEKIQRENFLAAKAEYEQSVYDALAEISSTLTQRAKLLEVMQKQEAAVAAYRESVNLAKDRYKQGLSSYYEVLTAQQGLFPAEKQLSNYQYQYAACIPTLYAQLGGGWRDLPEQQQ